MQNKPYYLAFLLFFAFACSDVFETDISEKQMGLLTPTDQLITQELQHTFWWEELEAATSYQLQIVSPNWEALESLVLDTTISANQFSLRLDPGTYTWQLRGLNASSETPWSSRTLQIDSTIDLSIFNVQQLSPVAGDTTNQQQQTFSWEPLYNATSYDLAIYDANNQSILSVNLHADTFSYLLPEGLIEWQVRALNESSETPFSSRFLLVDATAPVAPILTAPANEAVVDSLLTFSWQSQQDEGALIFDSLWVYTDSLLENEILRIQAAETYSHTLPTGTYYWHVRSFDEVGNTGGYSETVNFTVE